MKALYKEYLQVEPLYDITDECRKEEGFQCEMSRWDHGFICSLMAQRKPKKVVEVGVSAGGTTLVLHKCMELTTGNGALYSVDLNGKFYRDQTIHTGFVYEKGCPLRGGHYA